jgi:hypothetical protein
MNGSTGTASSTTTSGGVGGVPVIVTLPTSTVAVDYGKTASGNTRYISSSHHTLYYIILYHMSDVTIDVINVIYHVLCMDINKQRERWSS